MVQLRFSASGLSGPHEEGNADHEHGDDGQNTFYYGVFEYPEKSGNWYTGSHEPLVTKELYDKVQANLQRDQVIRSEISEFAFTKLITCGFCGSGITAQEKFKKLKDGGVARYVYYGCTRARDITCKSGYIREDELIEQLVKIMNKVDMNEIGIQHKFQEEVTRLKKFQYSFFNESSLKAHKEIDLKSYAKYLLKEGSLIEKRELLACVKNRLMLKQKVLTLKSEK